MLKRYVMTSPALGQTFHAESSDVVNDFEDCDGNG